MLPESTDELFKNTVSPGCRAGVPQYFNTRMAKITESLLLIAYRTEIKIEMRMRTVGGG